jgi:hypothetical protein
MDFHFLFIRLADGTEARPCNGDDEKGARTHHGFIPAQDNLKDIALYWRTVENAPRRYIGTYRLDLTVLLNAGYVRTASYHGKNGFRLKFVHADNDCIYIQKDSDSPRLVVGVFE